MAADSSALRHVQSRFARASTLADNLLQVEHVGAHDHHQHGRQRRDHWAPKVFEPAKLHHARQAGKSLQDEQPKHRKVDQVVKIDLRHSHEVKDIERVGEETQHCRQREVEGQTCKDPQKQLDGENRGEEDVTAQPEHVLIRRLVIIEAGDHRLCNDGHHVHNGQGQHGVDDEGRTLGRRWPLEDIDDRPGPGGPFFVVGLSLHRRKLLRALELADHGHSGLLLERPLGMSIPSPLWSHFLFSEGTLWRKTTFTALQVRQEDGEKTAGVQVRALSFTTPDPICSPQHFLVRRRVLASVVGMSLPAVLKKILVQAAAQRVLAHEIEDPLKQLPVSFTPLHIEGDNPCELLVRHMCVRPSFLTPCRSHGIVDGKVQIDTQKHLEHVRHIRHKKLHLSVNHVLVRLAQVLDLLHLLWMYPGQVALATQLEEFLKSQVLLVDFLSQDVEDPDVQKGVNHATSGQYDLSLHVTRLVALLREGEVSEAQVFNQHLGQLREVVSVTGTPEKALFTQSTSKVQLHDPCLQLRQPFQLIALEGFSEVNGAAQHGLVEAGDTVVLVRANRGIGGVCGRRQVLRCFGRNHQLLLFRVFHFCGLDI
mmetsp:Transcript_40309/g.94411  ORF Transcript_40309/g.94411 Transcript_40309/m.94411 type:complete len:594 (+) Transcript_40309:91-1872(+)